MRNIRNIFRNKTRSLLTAAGIAIGTFSVVIISGIGGAGTRQVSETLVTMGINSILVQPSSGVNITMDDSDLEEARKIKGVNKATPLMASESNTVLLGKTVQCFTWGVNSEAREIISLEAKHGRLINQADTAATAMVCVIDEEIAKSTYGRSNIVGKTAKILIGGAYRNFEIIGVARSGISSLQAALGGLVPNFCYIPYTTMQYLTGRTSCDRIAVMIKNSDDGIYVTNQLETRLNTKKGIAGALTANSFLQQKSQLDEILRTITAVLSLIAGISLFVSGLNVMTAMLVSVGERTREIGIKKSIGARDFDIMKEFLSESVLLTFLGSGSGAGLAIAACIIGGLITGFNLSPGVMSFAVPILVSVGMGALFGAYPAMKAAGMEPAEALRN